MRVGRSIAVVLGLLSNVAAAQTPIVANSTSFGGFFTPSVQAVGQSVLTPSGAWNAISFNFYDTVGDFQGVPFAVGPKLAYGGLYILTQAYVGLPSGLSGSTVGFVAVTSTIVGSTWIFDPSVVLQGNTQYYFLLCSVICQVSA